MIGRRIVLSHGGCKWILLPGKYRYKTELTENNLGTTGISTSKPAGLDSCVRLLPVAASRVRRDARIGLRSAHPPSAVDRRQFQRDCEPEDFQRDRACASGSSLNDG